MQTVENLCSSIHFQIWSFDVIPDARTARKCKVYMARREEPLVFLITFLGTLSLVSLLFIRLHACFFSVLDSLAEHMAVLSEG